MGRLIGSVNREKPFNDALRIALRSDPHRLRRIAEKLAEKAEEGDLAAIREIADRLDGKPIQMLDRRDVPVTELTDAELFAIAAGGLPEKEGDPKMLLLPPGPKSTP
jgi:hypothetical protein